MVVLGSGGSTPAVIILMMTVIDIIISNIFTPHTFSCLSDIVVNRRCKNPPLQGRQDDSDTQQVKTQSQAIFHEILSRDGSAPFGGMNHAFLSRMSRHCPY